MVDYRSAAISANICGDRTYAAGVRLSWPLVGRSPEMRAVEAAIVAPDVAGMVVYGAAGVGKTAPARASTVAVAGSLVLYKLAGLL